MPITTAVGPSAGDLRVTKSYRNPEGVTVAPEGAEPLGGLPPKFPVYDDLSTTLLAGPDSADEADRMAIAHTLAVASGYAYSDVGTEAQMMTRMGLEKSRCIAATLSVDAMFIKSTAYVIQSADGRVVIVAYRGTEPTNSISWLADADVHPDRIAFQFGKDVVHPDKTYPIHAGFYRNVRSTRQVVIQALLDASEGKPIHGDPDPDLPTHPMEALYITGHSFGGALASLLSVMLVTDDQYQDRFGSKLKGTYTFGQPMIGSREFAQTCDEIPLLKHHTRRYVYQNDPVPALPPKASGDFAHHGTELEIHEGSRGKAVERRSRQQERSPLRLLWAPVGFITRKFPELSGISLPYSLEDHFPHHYISALTPEGVANEFGDAELYARS
ncbi:lipase family protein [Gordonia insulae]|uniref:Fungal lipase-type domain-containing protein n=1 Tax=Gordonia insulae TaxID=2420509 RepID=A0A3G8JN89_9ACTN|nr:lipase family protein [Gordonia insulae]AZG46541.1 hypothetical protein D7316_03142 [Gordonia insulae]